MIQKSFFSLLILLSAIGISSCKKAGQGGKATLNVHVFNGSVNMPYSDVKVSFGSTGWPGTNAGYDLIVKCDRQGQVSIPELKRGNYYLYATNFDSTELMTPLPFLEGGTPFEITNRNGERSVVIDLAKDPE